MFESDVSGRSALIFTLLYVVVLALHFFYARFLIRHGRVDLAMGPIRSERAILSGLVILNGVSLIAFALPVPLVISLQIFLHAVLALDEMWRTWKFRARWVFFLNHALFTALLTAWLVYLQSKLMLTAGPAAP